jgi:hypothetical protein
MKPIIVKTDGQYTIRKLDLYDDRFYVFLREINLNPSGFVPLEKAEQALKNHKVSGSAIED